MKKISAFCDYIFSNYKLFICSKMIVFLNGIFHCSVSAIAYIKITAHTSIPSGWYVYGEKYFCGWIGKMCKIHLNYEKASLKNALSFNKAPETVTDAVFDNKKVNIYRDEITVSQLIAISGEVPPSLTGNISAYMAKEGNFLTAEQKFFFAFRQPARCFIHIIIHKNCCHRPSASTCFMRANDRT